MAEEKTEPTQSRCRWCRQSVESQATVCHHCGRDQGILGKLLNLAAIISMLAVALTIYQAWEARNERVEASVAKRIAEESAAKAEAALKEIQDVAGASLGLQGTMLLLSIGEADLWETYLKTLRQARSCRNNCETNNDPCFTDCNDVWAEALGKAGLPFERKAVEFQRIIDARPDGASLRKKICADLGKSYDTTTAEAFDILFADWCRREKGG